MTIDTHYHIGSQIGKRYLVHQVLLGGMGEVYLCLDTESNLPVALKTFQNRFLSNIRIREAFKDEIHTWVSLEKHPHIVHCHKMEVLDGQPFAVLDWIAGEEGRGTDLRGWLHSGPLTVKLALEVALDVCRGLLHAGQKQLGIIHCDLKPENILIAQGPVAKITDWGLARVVQQAGVDVQETDTQAGIRYSIWGKGGIAGTPAYMAPEQWQGEPLDVRTDIYALGCILYEMLTGHQPYQASTLAGYRRQHSETPIPVLVIEDEASNKLDNVTACCMAKTPEQRYQTVSAVAQSLEAIYRSRFSTEPRVLDDREEMTSRDFINRGVTYSLLEDYKSALADLNKAIEMGENLARAHINRGIVYTSSNRHMEALADFDRAEELDPTMPHIYINRAAALEALGRTDEALLDIEQAIKLDPKFPQPYHNRAQIFVRLKQYDKALDNFSQAIQIDPYNAIAFSDRGLLYREMGRYAESLTDLNRAIVLDPTNGYAYSNRGRLLSKLERRSEAIIDLDYAIQFHPAPLDVYLLRGEMYEALGDYDKALKNYAQVIDFDYNVPLHPGDAQLRLKAGHIGRALLLEQLNRYEEAMIEYDHLIQLDPSNTIYYQSRGDAFRELGRHEEALADFAFALKLEPNDAGTYNGRGITFYEMGDYDRALEDYRQSIELDPHPAEPYFNIGLILSLRDESNQALEYFEKSASLGYERGIQYAGEIRQRLGNTTGMDKE